MVKVKQFRNLLQTDLIRTRPNTLLEQMINSWVKESGVIIKDIKYTTTVETTFSNGRTNHTYIIEHALVLYEEN